MTRDDWLCPKCGNEMVKISSKYITCLCGNTRLFNTFGIADLPRAMKCTLYPGYWIPFFGTHWRYVPHGHKTALDKAPLGGCVVASVAFRGSRAVRLFQRKEVRKDTHKRSTEEIWDKIVARSERYTRKIEAHRENNRRHSRLMFSYRGGE